MSRPPSAPIMGQDSQQRKKELPRHFAPSDRVHGIALVRLISGIDRSIRDAATSGGVPVLDAVELVSVLRALVAHVPEYAADMEASRQRLDRIGRHGVSVSVVSVSWEGAS